MKRFRLPYEMWGYGSESYIGCSPDESPRDVTTGSRYADILGYSPQRSYVADNYSDTWFSHHDPEELNVSSFGEHDFGTSSYETMEDL